MHCACFRDVSFLYDVPAEAEKRPKPDQFDPTEIRKDEEMEERPKKKVHRFLACQLLLRVVGTFQAN